jgi:hypothetical protein
MSNMSGESLSATSPNAPPPCASQCAPRVVVEGRRSNSKKSAWTDTCQRKKGCVCANCSVPLRELPVCNPPSHKTTAKKRDFKVYATSAAWRSHRRYIRERYYCVSVKAPQPAKQRIQINCTPKNDPATLKTQPCPAPLPQKGVVSTHKKQKAAPRNLPSPSTKVFRPFPKPLMSPREERVVRRLNARPIFRISRSPGYGVITGSIPNLMESAVLPSVHADQTWKARDGDAQELFLSDARQALVLRRLARKLGARHERGLKTSAEDAAERAYAGLVRFVGCMKAGHKELVVAAQGGEKSNSLVNNGLKIWVSILVVKLAVYSFDLSGWASF